VSTFNGNAARNEKRDCAEASPPLRSSTGTSDPSIRAAIFSGERSVSTGCKIGRIRELRMLDRKWGVDEKLHGARPVLLGKVIRIADAKEVGVGNPAEETYRYPNQSKGYDLKG
jgi:hypothetical protein